MQFSGDFLSRIILELEPLTARLHGIEDGLAEVKEASTKADLQVPVFLLNKSVVIEFHPGASEPS